MESRRAYKLHKLLKRLGQAVHGSVIKSDEVRKCLNELHEDGWNAVMLLEASVSCRDNGIERGPASLRIHVDQTPEKVSYQIDTSDARLLESLGISPCRYQSNPTPAETESKPPSADPD
jgi:hypothetical protein